MRLLPPQPRVRLFATSLVMTAALAACGGGSDSPTPTTPVVEATPAGLTLEKIGGFSTGQYEVSAAEIPAFDAASKRLFVVNAQLGAVDVLNLANPANPVKIGTLDATAVLAGAEINSVAVFNGTVAVAIQAPVKTDPGRMALYRASDLSLISSVTIGAQPDMITFTPDGTSVLVANEGEPSDDYQTDPEGSISVIDVRNLATPVVRTAGFTAFNGQAAALRTAGVRIYGPGASVAQDLEPEYIAISADGSTAWVTLQENNALAKVNIATATVTNVLPLGYKDHGAVGNELDVADDEKVINIRNWAGVRGMYLPDSMASYAVAGQTYLVTANEGDARAWGETNDLYWGDKATATPGDASKGFVEEFRVKHLINKSGWSGREYDDLPPQLKALAAGGLLNPATFGYCGAINGDPLGCRADNALGRLNISWAMGYQVDSVTGNPIMYTAAGVRDDVNGNRLMYDNLYSYGARSFSIWDANGTLVWDSGAEIEKFLASADCKLGSNRSIPCATYFNSGHTDGNGLDSRSDAKGPEPEGLALGKIGNKTFAFIGLERMGGVLVYDITNPVAPKRVDYLNTRDEWVSKPEDLALAGNLATAGDLGPEGLVFIPAAQSPNGKPLLVVGNEVSGTTAVLQLNLTY
ncbi:hypothetical protein BSY239_2338 [Hydrogenophaga sp. RAC07]|uniref:choice-of-anchor I family protein n=1 Tax=Hydrogenophaga sp. RAC07 TaxID=1842537 RepID=UPI00083D0F59|nr:choice-of-anchor I family protein [Hydrogenophaga sp. RAC07]AOF87570.1 hypothetical protein BSY239_2338 [Hydrogenophaga sp. RAC07]